MVSAELQARIDFWDEQLKHLYGTYTKLVNDKSVSVDDVRFSYCEKNVKRIVQIVGALEVECEAELNG
jgi:hypothetical protein